jgi:hypothetical protein
MPTTPAEESTNPGQQSAVGRRWNGARAGDAPRQWPRCEPGFTHFELGASGDYRPTAVMAKRYTPKHGVRKE